MGQMINSVSSPMPQCKSQILIDNRSLMGVSSSYNRNESANRE